jgi:hypothetical protein
VNAYYFVDYTKQVQFFSGRIYTHKIDTYSTTLFCYDWISYRQNRIFRNAQNYSNVPMHEVITSLYTRINDQFPDYPLPFLLRTNNNEKQISLETSNGNTLSEKLNEILEQDENAQYRIVAEKGKAYLDY